MRLRTVHKKGPFPSPPASLPAVGKKPNNLIINTFYFGNLYCLLPDLHEFHHLSLIFAIHLNKVNPVGQIGGIDLTTALSGSDRCGLIILIIFPKQTQPLSYLWPSDCPPTFRIATYADQHQSSGSDPGRFARFRL